ncbi:PD-(D/E)XK motif protein [Gordonia alkanivorans]|uniref:PD-(D/E)XK motif protein n=1 Tax=Gordonia alkanivorans TaxID=84096 RepID=UPI000693DF44|nr:PD-(D/E)XK motif protein [Gordonia alkanivorans]
MSSLSSSSDLGPLGELFVLLASQVTSISGTQLLTRDTGVEIGGGRALVAIDGLKQKHLLVPMKGESPSTDDSSSGVSLQTRVLQVDGRSVEYVDLVCLARDLDLVFERLAEDVLDRLKLDDRLPLATCHLVLAEWRELLRAGVSPSHETLVGLVGELEVLKQLARRDPIRALEAWKGPSKALHDFSTVTRSLEVKGTSTVDGSYVAITHMDQLDSSIVPELHLAVAHVRSDAAGESIDGRIKSLMALGVPRSELLKKVREAGYLYENRLADEYRFTVHSLRLYMVDESFPGPRKNRISAEYLRGVRSVKYELSLDSVPNRMSTADSVSYWDGWFA